jgi:hypothetical protein
MLDLDWKLEIKETADMSGDPVSLNQRVVGSIPTSPTNQVPEPPSENEIPQTDP